MRKNVFLPNGNNKLTFQPEGAAPAASSLKSSYIKNEEKLSKERRTLYSLATPGLGLVRHPPKKHHRCRRDTRQARAHSGASRAQGRQYAEEKNGQRKRGQGKMIIFAAPLG